MHRARTLALVLPLAALASGCFVFDELDAGMEIMEAHTPASEKKKKAGETADGEKPPTYQETVQSWWKDAKSINVSPQERLDTDDPMVPCAHGGKTVFTKRSDCIARGGRAG